jgi:GNAT superfamily N-acetyltransferase
MADDATAPEWISHDEILGRHDDADPTIFSRIRYLISSYVRDEIHLVVRSQGRVVAMAGLEKAPHTETTHWLKFVSVDPDHRGNGHARALLEAVYEWASENSLTIEPSTFTADGERCLVHVLQELDARHPGVTSWTGRNRAIVLPAP